MSWMTDTARLMVHANTGSASCEDPITWASDERERAFERTGGWHAERRVCARSKGPTGCSILDVPWLCSSHALPGATKPAVCAQSRHPRLAQPALGRRMEPGCSSVAAWRGHMESMGAESCGCGGAQAARRRPPPTPSLRALPARTNSVHPHWADYASGRGEGCGAGGAGSVMGVGIVVALCSAELSARSSAVTGKKVASHSRRSWPSNAKRFEVGVGTKSPILVRRTSEIW
mmetsp:Transcript_4510/g.9739  ORF Transcript_4510/g.9739 Transcript_4510/m.9739 type:complete len:232 (-) Transcript_4510:1274-1969(-)